MWIKTNLNTDPSHSFLPFLKDSIYHFIEKGKTYDEIEKKIYSKLTRLSIFLEIKKIGHVKESVVEIVYFQRKYDIFKNQSHGLISKSYLEQPITGKDKNFLKNLIEFRLGHIESFAEIVEYYEYVKGHYTKFHSLRNALSHFETDEAIQKIKKDFPNEFEFKNNEFLRDSIKNTMALDIYRDEIFDELALLIK